MSWDFWDLFFLMGIHDFEIDGKKTTRPVVWTFFLFCNVSHEV